ncbi:MAG: 3-phosphoshikimate 1-carboxyvinyltransferase [Betaproteobacteria bacterium]|jgi:3-phosphoshikimate 1-carboxyvinyltransferase|nr:3-phosphoshikimate 1-carboxyvinyltransferase [Betaproteobacteria bacterium]
MAQLTRREYLDLPALARAAGSVQLPGSKSISNRTLLLCALCEGRTRVLDLLRSDDTQRMLEALALLGVHIERSSEGGAEAAGMTAVVDGCGGDLPVREADLFLGNAGTAFRPLTAALAAVGGHFHLRGVPRMHERPIGDLVDSLRGLGARIDYRGNEGYPPLEIHPARLVAQRPIRVRGDVSSQFLTALLLASPMIGVPVQARGAPLVIEVEGELISKPYVEITLALMARFGVVVEREGWQRFRVPSGSRYRSPGTVHVEGDASAASYFLAAGAIGGGPVRVNGVGRGSIQGDVAFADALRAMGARVELGENWIEAAAPSSGRLRGIDLDCNLIPDAAMTLGMLALFANGPTTLRNIASWRVKETDRIHAMATELAKLGATVEAGPDYLRVAAPAALVPGAVIDTYDDHRVAMCFSLAALGGVPVRINDPDCVAKTFPDYFDVFGSIAS